MAKVTVSEAIGLTGVSESTIRRDIKSGKASSEKDTKGHRRIDTAELGRVYHLTPPPECQTTAHDSQKIVTVMEQQVSDLKAELERSHQRETALIDEKAKLLELANNLQKQNEVLMLPSATATPVNGKVGWVQRLRKVFSGTADLSP